MASASPTLERCDAKTRSGGHYERYPCEGSSRCPNHGGKSSGPADSSLLKGNTHAARNDGGAPTGNTNAWRHGGFADLDKLDGRLEGGAREWVDRRDRRTEEILDIAEETAADRGPDRRRRLAREWALVAYCAGNGRRWPRNRP